MNNIYNHFIKKKINSKPDPDEQAIIDNKLRQRKANMASISLSRTHAWADGLSTKECNKIVGGAAREGNS